jgi:hypothetical protein
MAALEAYPQLGIDSSLQEQKVGTHRRQDDAVPGAELKRLQREVAALASSLGYEP